MLRLLKFPKSFMVPLHFYHITLFNKGGEKEDEHVYCQKEYVINHPKWKNQWRSEGNISCRAEIKSMSRSLATEHEFYKKKKKCWHNISISHFNTQKDHLHLNHLFPCITGRIIQSLKSHLKTLNSVNKMMWEEILEVEILLIFFWLEYC